MKITAVLIVAGQGSLRVPISQHHSFRRVSRGRCVKPTVKSLSVRATGLPFMPLGRTHSERPLSGLAIPGGDRPLMADQRPIVLSEPAVRREIAEFNGSD